MATQYVSMEFDAKQMIKLLGNDLYDSPLAMLRENVQNAYDAILERRHINANFEPQINIDITPESVCISDNGIGMNKDILANNYWRAGNSGKNNAQSKAAGVVGHFGIGALANFGVCKELDVVTHRYGESMSYHSVANRERLNVKDSISIEELATIDSNFGTTVKAVLEIPGSIDRQSAINYLKPYIEYISVPVFINGIMFPHKKTELSNISFSDNIEDGNISYNIEIDHTQSLPINAEINVHNIIYMGTKIDGYIYLNSKSNSIMGLRNGFGLANVNIATTYNWGGVANLSNLIPTAGREAIGRESVNMVASIVRSVEKVWTNYIAENPLCDQYREFLQTTIKQNG